MPSWNSHSRPVLSPLLTVALANPLAECDSHNILSRRQPKPLTVPYGNAPASMPAFQDTVEDRPRLTAHHLLTMIPWVHSFISLKLLPICKTGLFIPSQPRRSTWGTETVVMHVKCLAQHLAHRGHPLSVMLVPFPSLKLW